MMKAIRDGSTDGFVWQSLVRRALGVCAPTVSRMLKSLEELGFVVRKRVDYDKREIDVGLTEEGLRRFNEAVSALLLSGDMDRSFQGAVASDWSHREEHAAQALERLDAIRTAFHDTADDYLYRVTRRFCPGHFTQRKLPGSFYERFEADAFAGICIRDRVLRDTFAAVQPY